MIGSSTKDLYMSASEYQQLFDRVSYLYGSCIGWIFGEHTGKTSGIPPRTALVPSSLAPSLNHSFSSPEASFQLRTVAPKSRTSTLSPEGSTAVTRELPWVIVVWACGGMSGVGARAEGLFRRSIMVAGRCLGGGFLWGVVLGKLVDGGKPSEREEGYSWRGCC